MRCGSNRGETWHGAQAHSPKRRDQAELFGGTGGEAGNGRERGQLGYWGQQGRLWKRQSRLGVDGMLKRREGGNEGW